jgi:deazaflavin-dependent oxidoreductase (nitroreductase family)
MSNESGPDQKPAYRSAEEQRRAYREGEWGNPLTSTPMGGRILSALQLPLFLIFPSAGFGVLTTVGRKTGKKRRKCVRAIARGDKVFLVSLRGRYGAWYRNLEANPLVNLRIREGRFRGTAREIQNSDEYARAREAYCGTVNFFDRFEYLAHRLGWPTMDRIRDLHTRWFTVCTPIVIELDRAANSS